MNTLRKGSKGDDVRVLQSALNRAGYNLNVDGDFGSKTQNAVIDFQGNHDLDPDGVCGPLTWKALEAYMTENVIQVINQCVNEIMESPTFKRFMEMIGND